MVTRRRPVRFRRKPRSAALDDLRALVQRRPVKLVRPFLRPAQAALFAEHLDVKPVHAPDRDRARPQPQDRAAIHAEGDHGVVLQRAACEAGDEVGGEFARLLAGDEACHVQRVDAAIGELRRDAGLCRIVAPAHARIVGIRRVGMEAVREFGLDEADLAQIAARHHGPHVAHQRIARIAVIDGADRTGARGRCDDILAPRPPSRSSASRTAR